jgi:hypothetical protein
MTVHRETLCTANMTADNKLTANICVSLVICSGYRSAVQHAECAQQQRLMSECSYTWIEIIATTPDLVTAEERLAVVLKEAATGGGAFNSQAGPFNLGGGNWQQTTRWRFKSSKMRHGVVRLLDPKDEGTLNLGNTVSHLTGLESSATQLVQLQVLQTTRC